MPVPHLRLVADPEALAQAAADAFLEHGNQAIARRGRFTVVLSGGSTPKRLYQLLAQPDRRARIDWSRIDFFWGDERCVPPDHEQSNYGMAWKELLQGLQLDPARIHRLRGEDPDPAAAARSYQMDIADALGISADDDPPTFDLVFLGMGPDGHTASLFPHTQALQPTIHWVVPNYVPKFQAHRLTMTPRILNRARAIMFLVGGADKADVLQEVLEGPLETDRLPSQLIQSDEGNLTWIVDRMAAAKLRNR